MKLNIVKCHLLVAGHKYKEVFIKLDNNIIWESQKVKLLGVTINKNISFDEHIAEVCKKAHTKLTALIRIAQYFSLEKKRALFKAFIESQFRYNRLTWMFHNRSSYNKINNLHERALRIVYDDVDATFEELLLKDKSFTIHQQNLHALALQFSNGIITYKMM